MDIVSELKIQSSDLSDRLRVRQEECDNLRDLVRGSTEELVSLQIRLRESREAHSSLNAELLPLRRKHHNLERQSALLEKRCAELEAALVAQKQEIRSSRKAAEEASYSGAIQLRTARAELEQSRVRCSALSDQLALQSERTDEHIRRVQELEVAGAQRFTAYDSEVSNKDSMIALYKRFHEDSLTKVATLEEQLSVLRAGQSQALAAAKQAEEAQRAQQEQAVEQACAQAAAQLKDLREQLGHALQAAAAQASPAAASAALVVRLSADDAYGAGSSELYEAYEQAQQQAAHERGARREAELYLGRILEQVEAKAPIIARQKTQFVLLQQEKERLESRMQAVLRENSLLRDHVRGIETDADAAMEHAEALEQQNTDLSCQLQHILSGGKGSSSAADGDVVTERLVTFNDAQELQTRNAQLLKVVRALSKDPDAAMLRGTAAPASSLGDSKPLSDTLTAALDELQAMREARSQAENLLHAALLQRDEYKAMLPANLLAAEKENRYPANIAPGTGIGIGCGTGTGTTESAAVALKPNPADEAALKRLQQRCEALQKELADLKHSTTAAADCARTALAAARGEAAAFRGEVAHWEGVGRSATEKQERLERSLHSLRVECTSAVSARLDLESLVAELERRVQRLDAEVIDSAATARAAEDSCRAAETEAALARSAEHAAEEALAVLREDTKAEAILAEGLRRVEAGLAARHADEKESLTRDRDALARDLLALRKQLHELEILSSQRCASLDAELMVCHSVADESAAEAHDARLALVSQQGAAQGAQEKVQFLEKQLARTQERMSALQGMSNMEDVLAKQAAEHESVLERLQAEARDATALAAAADQHVLYFQAIAAAAESKWLQLQKEHSATIACNGVVIQSKSDELALALALSNSEQARATALQDEANSLKAELAALRAAQQALVTEHEAELGASSAAAASGRSLGVQQEAEIGRLNQLLTAAEAGLAEHRALLQAATEAQAKAEAEAARTATALSLNNQAIAELSASAVVQQLQLSEDKSKVESALDELRESNQDLRRSNDLLHAQMQTLAARVRRYEEDGRPGAGGATGMDDADASGTEEQLKLSLDELREVLWTIKRERDMLAAKLAVSESEAARHQSTVTTLQAAADELRLISKRDSEKLAPTRGEKEFAQLLQQVQQLGKIREQSQAVHADNERLSQTNERLAKELQVVKEGVAPRERQARMLQAEKSQLEAQMAQLTSERVTWMARLEDVLARYADVDPADYRAVRDRETAARAEATAAQAQLQQAAVDAAEQEKAHLAAQAAKEEELSTVRAAKLASEKSAEMLRTKLRQLKVHKEDASRKESESQQTLEALTAEVEALRARTAAQDRRDAAARAALEEEEMQEEAAAMLAAGPADADAAEPAEAEEPRNRKRSYAEESSQLALAAAQAPPPSSSSSSGAAVPAPAHAHDAAPAGTPQEAKTNAQKQTAEMERLKALLIKKREAKGTTAPAAAAKSAASASGANEEGAAPLAKRPRGARSSSVISIQGDEEVADPTEEISPAGGPPAGAPPAAPAPAPAVRNVNPFASTTAGSSNTSNTSNTSSSEAAILSTAFASAGDSSAGTSLLPPAATFLKATTPYFVPFTKPYAQASSSAGAGTGPALGSSALPLFGGKTVAGPFGFMGGAKASFTPFGAATAAEPPAYGAGAGSAAAAELEDADAAAKARRAARFGAGGGSTGAADED